MKMPDFIEPFIGWKGLHANERGVLFSPQSVIEWPAGAPLEAKCHTHSLEKIPVKSCGCGVYAVKTFDQLVTEGYNWNAEYDHAERGHCVAVIAEVKIFGDVIPGAIGWRGQKAYPSKVYVPAWKLPLGKIIGDRYGIPFGIIDRKPGRR